MTAEAPDILWILSASAYYQKPSSTNMPPVSMDDYHKLLQKIAVLETKIHRLEVNMEVNGQYGNETTRLMTQNNKQEQTGQQLTSTTKKDEAYTNSSKSTKSCAWNSFGAKPKHKLVKDELLPLGVGHSTGKTQHLVVSNEVEWPALSSHTSASSTPKPAKKPLWTVATTRNKSRPTQDTGIQLENRSATLFQDPETTKESSSSTTKERYETEPHTKRLQKELTTEPQTLIVGDGAVDKIKYYCSKKNTVVLCFTNTMVSDISKKILKIADEHPTVKYLIIHTGALDVVKQQSEVLKQEFIDLLNKVQCLNTKVFFSSPLPTVRRGDERFSRLMMLNRWLQDICAAQSVNFIDNFTIFWERRHLFKADGLCLIKAGVQLLSSNIFYFVKQAQEVKCE